MQSRLIEVGGFLVLGFFVGAMITGCGDENSPSCPGQDAATPLPDGTTDPCEGVDCSGHGSCVVDQAGARCDCEEGYSAQGLSCVEETGVSSFFAVPDYTFLSNAGGYVAYAGMSPVPDTNQREFESGDFVVRDAATGQETVVLPSLDMISTTMGTFFPVQVVFDRNDERMFVIQHKDGPDRASAGLLVNLGTGDIEQAGDLGPYEHIATTGPDLDWALVSKQTYLGDKAQLKFMQPITGQSELVAESCRDIHLGQELDTVTVDGTVYAALDSCERSGNDTTWTLAIHPVSPAGDPVVVDQVQTKKVVARPNGIVYETNDTGEVRFADLTGNASADLGTGSLDSVSPDGSLAVIIYQDGDSRTSLLVRTDTGEQVRDLGLAVVSAWVGDNTLYYRPQSDDGSLELYRTVAGGEPEGLGVDAAEVYAMGDGRVWTLDAVAGQGYSLVVKDDAEHQMPIQVLSMRHAFIVDGTDVTDLGIGTFWQVSPTYILRGDFYYDVLRGGLPDPNNGFYLYQP